MSLPRWHNKYVEGVDGFIKRAISQLNQGDQICCPCTKCVFNFYYTMDVEKDHLIADDFMDGYDKWFFHGEERRKNVISQILQIKLIVRGCLMILMVYYMMCIETLHMT